MIVFVSLLVFLGFYALYNTSKKATLNKTKIDKWLQNHPKIARSIGLVMVFSSFDLLIKHYGIGAGTFIAFIILMTLGGLIIVLAPLFLNNKHQKNASKP